ncbi:MAG: ABC transporter permease [Actinomycetota bacterium]
MNKLFGIPTGGFAVGTAAFLALTLLVVGILAVRNPVFVKLGLRNIPRRRGRTVLIVAGLMLGTTIIASALATGDTMSTTIRSDILRAYGQTDEIISAKSLSTDAPPGLGTRPTMFTDTDIAWVEAAAKAFPDIDGVAPAIAEPIAVAAPRSRQNEPRVNLFAADPASMSGFGTIKGRHGAVTLGALGPHAVYLNQKAADSLDARPGDSVIVYAGDRQARFVVRDVVSWHGTLDSGASALAPLTTAQRLLGEPHGIEHILISNRGGETSGAALTDRVVKELSPTVHRLHLAIDKQKQDGLTLADAQGNGFMSLFTTFGSFSIVAGILLIFLLFVMLAAERRGELGIARAIGTRRGHLVELYLFEGIAYDLLAAIVGVVLGVAVAFGMVFMLARAFASFGFDITFHVTARSLVLAYTLGVLLTLIVVTLSAWRVSRLNISSAVRNLPDPELRKRGRRRWILSVVGLVLGLLLLVSGVSAANGTSFLLGFSLTVISLAVLATKLRLPPRIAYTGAGVAIIVFALLPLGTWDRVTQFSLDYTYFLVGGLVIVLGATWVIIYNAEPIVAAISWAFGGVRSAAPVLKLSTAYPMRNLFRTGVTLAMFMLVVFTLVTGTTISGSFVHAWDRVDLFGGGFDVRGQAAPATPIRDLSVALAKAPGIHPGDIRVAATQASVPLKLTQLGSGRKLETYPVLGFDDRFLARTTYGFAAIAKGYGSAADVWRAVRTRPNLAVVDGIVAPRRDNWNFGVLPKFRLSGFYVEDGSFDPVPVVVHDDLTGKQMQVTVIGVLKDASNGAVTGLATSERTLFRFVGRRSDPTTYWFKLRPGLDPKATAKTLESAFLTNGMDAESLQATLDDQVGASKTFNLIIEAFMGLGLVVGVAALGVITARAVVERRQQIGVLRAIGFQRRMIQAAFLLESSFIALTAIVVGTGLGLAISYNVVADSASQPGWDSLTFTVPWLSLGAIFLLVYLVALGTTLWPAVRASRVYPAEALRYQ